MWTKTKTLVRNWKRTMLQVCGECGCQLSMRRVPPNGLCPRCRSRRATHARAATPLERRLRALHEVLDRHSGKPARDRLLSR